MTAVWFKHWSCGGETELRGKPRSRIKTRGYGDSSGER